MMNHDDTFDLQHPLISACERQGGGHADLPTDGLYLSQEEIR